MSYFRRAIITLVFIMLFYSVFSGKAYSYNDLGTDNNIVQVLYIDPGTASIVIQVLIGALVGALVSVKIFWGRISASIKSFFSKRRHETGKE